MKAIDNSGLKNFCHTCQVAGWAPAVTFSLANSTKILTLTDTSTYPSGDDRNVLNATITDRFGNVKTAQMLGSDVDDAFTIDLSTGFNITEGFVIQVMIVSNNRLIADLTAYDVYRYNTATTGTTAGSLGYLDTTP
ncbi:MAG: hypothetical protein EOP04_18575 [Proteobacteria bacterium]|nr:MAG: hypothetical protein EOP04_18575 [Pseudomonadota bacterium]